MTSPTAVSPVQGGLDTDTATIEMLDADGQQSLALNTDGDLQVLGGVGDTASALVTSAGLDAGAGNEAQRIVIDAGQLVVDAGDGANANSTAQILQTNTNAASQFIAVNDGNATGSPDGSMSVLGGDGANETALIGSAGTVAQTLNIATGLTVTGGDGLNSSAGISADGTSVDQTVTVTTGNAELTGGAGDNAHAFIDQTDAVGTQDININAADAASNLALLGGTGINADARISAQGTLQTVTLLNGALTVQADQTAAGTANADAYILADNTAAGQDIDVTDGGIVVEGGVGDTETAYISLAGADGTGSQTINLNGMGDFDVLGGTGLNATASVISDGLVQTITLDNGALNVQGDQTGGGNNGGNALVSLADNAGVAVQTLDVTNGGILVQGGLDTDTATIEMLDTNGQQSLALVDDGDLVVEGGDGADATAIISSTGVDGGAMQEAQRIVVDAGQLTVRANQDAANDGGHANISQLNGGAASQFIQVADGAGSGAPDGTMQVLGGAGNELAEVLSAGNTAQTIEIANGLTMTGGEGIDAEARMIASGTSQDITVSNGDLIMRGDPNAAGTSGASALINATGGSATQTITASNNIELTGGVGTDEFALILASGGSSTQTISNTSAGDITIEGGTGTDAFASIRAINEQEIESIGRLLLTGASGTNSGGFAQVEALGEQEIEAETGITLNGGTSSGNGDNAVIHGGDLQTITVNTGNLALNANDGEESAPLGVENAGASVVADGDQTINVNGGDLALTGGSNASALIDMTGTNGGTLQDINVTAGNAGLDDGTGGNARINTATDQVVTTSGTTDMTGDNGNESLFNAGATSTLENDGGTWTGVANVTATTSVTIDNTGAIVIDETPGSGIVTAPTLIFTGGTGQVGSMTDGVGGADTRLNTDVDTIEFDGVAGKTVNISETDGVALQGTGGTLDLITDNAGDITDGTAAFNTTNATLQTADGDIDLSGQTNGVQNFRGVVANNGSFDYLGGQDVTIEARNDSAEVPAGEDIFADNTLTINVGGNNIVLSGGTKTGGSGPGGGDGTILTGSTQDYESNVVLDTDYAISSDGSTVSGCSNIPRTAGWSRRPGHRLDAELQRLHRQHHAAGLSGPELDHEQLQPGRRGPGWRLYGQHCRGLHQ
ncbi:MAG: hypothetical protein U5P41_09640 [Gammaproteobacteria bacterium]|nr:hypothetical protein [Gammaproteobacteria bacterium]